MKNIVNAFAFLAAALLFVSGATAVNTTGPESTPNETVTSTKPVPKRFAVPNVAGKTKVGNKTTLQVKVSVAKGWKWNEQYPAKLEFKDVPVGVSLDKAKYSQLKGDFKSSKQAASVALRVSGKKTGETTVVGKMKFSVCNETTCVIEKAPVSVVVSVL
jgi:hypothetical protein